MSTNKREFKDIFEKKENKKIVIPGADLESSKSLKNPSLTGRRSDSKSINDISKQKKDVIYFKQEEKRLPRKVLEILFFVTIAFFIIFVTNIFNVYLLSFPLKDQVINFPKTFIKFIT